MLSPIGKPDYDAALGRQGTYDVAQPLRGVESEQAGIDFLTNLHGHVNWKQTSYNGSIRKNYAGIGFTYDSVLDFFYAPQPYPSWSLNTETAQWEAPIPMPVIEGKRYAWFEPNQEWIELTPPAGE